MAKQDAGFMLAVWGDTKEAIASRYTDLH